MNSALQFIPSPYASFMQETRVSLPNGVQLHVEVGGNPEHPTILMIMGLGAQMLYWPDEFCKQLIDHGFRVIRFDNRDIGLSSKIRFKGPRLNTLKLMSRFALGLPNSGSPYTLFDMAEDVSHLIDQLGLERVHVLGASMGGMIAQILAAKHPHKVQKLGLLFTSNNRALLPPPFPKQLMSLIGRPASNDEEGIVQHIVKLYQTIGSPGFVNVDEAKITARKLYQRSYYPAGVLQQFLAILCTGSLSGLSKNIHQQTLVLHGARDRLLPPSHGKAVAKSIKQAKFELIAGMGHDIQPHFVPKLAQNFAQHFKTHQ